MRGLPPSNEGLHSPVSNLTQTLNTSSPELPERSSAARRQPLGAVALTWGAGGFLAMLAWAMVRLGGMSLESLSYSWGAVHWTVLVLNLGVMAWFEGYKGFQQGYSPRFAARCHRLYHATSLRQALLAPLVAMGLLDAPRRRLVSAWALTVGIVIVVLVYRQLPQPWRGILDAGVLLGLGWGMAATAWSLVRAFRDGPVVEAEFR